MCAVEIWGQERGKGRVKLLNQSDLRPRSEPALELHRRAVSSVGVMYRYSGPNTGSSSGGGRIQKKVKKQAFSSFDVFLINWNFEMRAKLCSPYVCEITQRKWWMQKQPDLMLSVLCLSVFQNRTNRGVKICSEKKVSKGQNRYCPNLLGTCRLIFTWELLWGTKDHFLTFIWHISVELIFRTLFTHQKYLASFSPIISPTSQLKSQVKKIKIYIFVMHFKFSQSAPSRRVASSHLHENFENILWLT